jgi:hypothetical protein
MWFTMGAMAVPTIALPEARNALNRAADRWADLLRSLPDTRATIPGRDGRSVTPPRMS